MPRIVSRTIAAMSTYPAVVTSPAMCTWPVVISVSTATRLRGSCSSIASRMASLIWSAILSGWPSVTDSDVKRRRDTRFSLDRQADRSDPSGQRYRRTPTVGVSALGGARPAEGDSGPDAGRDGVLAPARDLRGGAIGGEHDRCVVGPAERLPGRDVVDHEQVAALAGQLGAAVGEDVGVGVTGLGGEADDQLAGRALGDQFGEDVGIAHQRHRARLGGGALLQLRGRDA